MSEPRSRRARILKNLQRQLETITVLNGYSTTVAKVTQSVKNWQDTPVAETPVLYIIDENTTYKYNPGKLLEHEWRVALYGLVKDKSQLEGEEFISDIEECLMLNKTLSMDGVVPGPAAYLKIVDITTDNQLFAEIENSMLFKITLNILYTGCIDNPR